MNNFQGSGKITRNAIVRGDKKRVLLFTIAASSEVRKGIDFIPCTLFESDEELIKLLTERGKGLEVEFTGYVATSRVQQDGTVRYFTRVIINPESLNVLE